MIKAKIFNNKIFACPECKRRFSRVRALNTHLSNKHNSKYHVVIKDNQIAMPVARKVKQNSPDISVE